MSRISEAREFYARLMAGVSRSSDPRLERIFELVPREAFLPPGPWQVLSGRDYVWTPTADPALLYQNVLVALDPEKGINNGEPFLHAAWIGQARPQPGETVIHVGAGTGYYSAILAMLVLPGGTVHAFEVDEALAAAAVENLAPFDNVTLRQADATAAALEPADLIYVNAGLAAPLAAWLDALKPAGRMIFPWRPAAKIGLAVLVTRETAGFACRPFMNSWFIPLVGAPAAETAARLPAAEDAWRTRSIWLVRDCPPDDTATAIFDEVWFSSRTV